MPVDIDDVFGTALTRAAWNNQTDVARVLLVRGANVNKRGRFGWTSLHETAASNSINVMRILLQHGASADIKDDNDETPIEVARRLNNEEAVCLLQQY